MKQMFSSALVLKCIVPIVAISPCKCMYTWSIRNPKHTYGMYCSLWEVLVLVPDSWYGAGEMGVAEGI